VALICDIMLVHFQDLPSPSLRKVISPESERIFGDVRGIESHQRAETKKTHGSTNVGHNSNWMY